MKKRILFLAASAMMVAHAAPASSASQPCTFMFWDWGNCNFAANNPHVATRTTPPDDGGGDGDGDGGHDGGDGDGGDGDGGHDGGDGGDGGDGDGGFGGGWGDHVK